MLKRRSLLKSVPAGALGAAAAGTLASPRLARAEDGTLAMAYPADVPSWDPNGNPTIVMPIFKSVFDNPIALTPDLKIGESIITDYSWLDDDGKTLKVKLRPGVTFHNGDPLTSADIRFTFFERLRADKTLFLAGIWNSLISDIETPSPDTAIFHFGVPVVSAPQQLGGTSALIVPKKYIEQVGVDGFQKKPIGSGPYRMVDWQRDSRIILEANDKYWGGAPSIKRVTIQIIKDPSARAAAIQAGQVQFVHNMPVREVLRLGALPNLTGVIHSINNVVMIQCPNKGVFKDKNLRLAMHHAIDKQALSKAFFNGQVETLNTWSGPGQAAYDPTFKFSYSPDLAKEYLAKGGYGPGKPAKFVFYTFNGVFPSDLDLGRAIVQMWKRVGIDADLEVIEIAKWSNQHNTETIENPGLFSWSNPTGNPNIYSGTLMDPRKRFSVFKSEDVIPRIDPLLRQTNYQKRIEGYKELDRWVVEQGYAMPLLQGASTIVHTKKLKYVPFLNGWVLPAYWSMI